MIRAASSRSSAASRSARSGPYVSSLIPLSHYTRNLSAPPVVCFAKRGSLDCAAILLPPRTRKDRRGMAKKRKEPRKLSPPPSAFDQARDELFSHIRSEEHTSELQSHSDLVCRLLLEKKKSAAVG